MKQSIILTLIALLSVVYTQASEQIGDLYYDLNETDHTASVTFPPSGTSYSGDIVIPASVNYDGADYSVTSIGERAFSNYTGLTSISISNSVTTIDNYAFARCSGLTAITIPSSVTTIGEDAFISCSGLASITVETGNTVYDSRNNCNAIIKTATNTLILGCKNTSIPSDVTSIGDAAFYWCSGLTTITIPNGVTSIGRFAFQGCSGLTSVTLSNSLTNIGDYAFYDCSVLTSVTIPDGVTTIGDAAFADILNIEYHGTATGSPWGAKCVNAYVEDMFVYADNTKTKLLLCLDTATDAITVPTTVKVIADNAFYNCSELTSITLPKGIDSIGNRAFNNCSKLTSIDLPDGLKALGEYAFYQCDALSTITIPSSVTTIKSSAFRGCTGLTKLTVEATTPPTIQSNTFRDVDHTIPVYVPEGSVDAYKSADYWSEFTNIQSSSPATAIDNTDSTDTPRTATRKIFRNGQILIQHNNHLYTLTGVEVK